MFGVLLMDGGSISSTYGLLFGQSPMAQDSLQVQRVTSRIEGHG